MSELRSLQAEWNALVPVAHSLGIYSGVRILRSTHENTGIGRRRVAELRARIEARQPTATAPFVAPGAQGDTFGVEIEVIMPSGLSHYGLAQAITAAGVACEAQRYNHQLITTWKVVQDGSLGSHITGAEVVSPILTGEAGFATMAKVMDAMTAAGCKITKRCGFHVHVGARRENVHFFRSLARIYRKFDAAINSVLAPSRTSNDFCHAHIINETRLEAATSIDEVTRAVGQMPGRDYIRSSYRYRKLNFCSFFQHGTVEFRQHQGSTDARKAAYWVRFCLAMVAAARRNPDLSLYNDSLDALMTLTESPTDARAYFNSRVAVFAARATSRRTA